MIIARKRYIQERITTGQLTLPVAILVVSVVWLVGSLPPIRETESGLFWNKLLETLQGTLLRNLIGYLLVGVAAIQLLLLHNTFALIRAHTNFYLSLFILLAGLLLPPTLDVASLIVPCMLLSTHNLFHCYQQPQSVGYAFQAFLCLSIGSLLFPPLLYYVPLLYIGLAHLRAFTARTFFAGLVGVGLPYWCLLVYTLCAGEMMLFPNLFGRLVPEWPPNYADWTLYSYLSLGYIVMLTVAGSLHCLINNYEDKIKTRAMLGYLVTLQAWTLLFLLLQPQHFATLLPILITGSSLVAGHLFALCRSKAGNLFFLGCTLLFIALILFHLWTYSHSNY